MEATSGEYRLTWSDASKKVALDDVELIFELDEQWAYVGNKKTLEPVNDSV